MELSEFRENTENIRVENDFIPRGKNVPCGFEEPRSIAIFLFRGR